MRRYKRQLNRLIRWGVAKRVRRGAPLMVAVSQTLDQYANSLDEALKDALAELGSYSPLANPETDRDQLLFYGVLSLAEEDQRGGEEAALARHLVILRARQLWD